MTEYYLEDEEMSFNSETINNPYEEPNLGNYFFLTILEQ